MSPDQVVAHAWPPPAEGGEVPYVQTLLAVRDPDSGERRYVYGWSRAVVTEMERPRVPDSDFWQLPVTAQYGPPEYRSSVEWAAPPMLATVRPARKAWQVALTAANEAHPGVALEMAADL